jgi:hypothetical protein
MRTYAYIIKNILVLKDGFHQRLIIIEDYDGLIRGALHSEKRQEIDMERQVLKSHPQPNPAQVLRKLFINGLI